jgi:hypothetical protein
MIAVKITGANKTYKGDGCNDLDIREDKAGIYYIQNSAWKPTPEELTALNAGNPVILSVYGRGHPPVRLSVENV